MRLSEDVESILHRAQRLAARAGRDMTSLHVLLATRQHDSWAGRHLESLGADEQGLLDALQTLQTQQGQRLTEAPDVLARIEDHMGRVAGWTDFDEVRCLHLLLALVRLPEAIAARVLEAHGLPAAEVRVTTLSRALDLLALPAVSRATDGALWDTPLELDPHDPGPSEEEALQPSEAVRARRRGAARSREG